MTGTRGGLVQGAHSPAAQLPMSLQPHTLPDAQGQALALYSVTTVSSMARTGFVIWEQGYRRGLLTMVLSPLSLPWRR